MFKTLGVVGFCMALLIAALTPWEALSEEVTIQNQEWKHLDLVYTRTFCLDRDSADNWKDGFISSNNEGMANFQNAVLAGNCVHLERHVPTVLLERIERITSPEDGKGYSVWKAGVMKELDRIEVYGIYMDKDEVLNNIDGKNSRT